MYAGFITSRHAARWLGTHQKLNRVAHRVLKQIDAADFPTIKSINHFEGYRGPDGLKTKSHHDQDPDTLYDPVAEAGGVLDQVTNHFELLAVALRDGDKVRSAFEASWLAHYITDGLTPAHHPPFKEYSEGLRNKQPGGRVKDKLMVTGATALETIKQTWLHVGARGQLSSHIHFELGVASVVVPARVKAKVSTTLLALARELGPVDFFKHQAKMVDSLHLYRRFRTKGWTTRIARDVKHKLAPIIAQTIAIAWLLAYEEAEARTEG